MDKILTKEFEGEFWVRASDVAAFLNTEPIKAPTLDANEAWRISKKARISHLEDKFFNILRDIKHTAEAGEQRMKVAIKKEDFQDMLTLFVHTLGYTLVPINPTASYRDYAVIVHHLGWEI